MPGSDPGPVLRPAQVLSQPGRPDDRPLPVQDESPGDDDDDYDV